LSNDLEVFEYQKKFDIERERASDAYLQGSDALRSYYDSRGCQRCFQDYDHSSPENMRQYGVIRPAYENYMEPKTRRKDRYYCAMHTRSLNAAIGANGGLVNVSGHTCWAYTSHPSYQESRPWYTGTFAAGLPDDPGLKPNTLTVYNEMQTDAPSKGLELCGCTMQKNLVAGDGNYEEALLRSLKMRDSTYFLIGNNCMDATSYILDGFGVEWLPIPTLHTPYSYFAQIPGEIITLHP
jgi:hypothetical protein